MSKLAHNVLNSAQTIVIKIGSNLVVDTQTHKLRQEWFSALAENIKTLRDQGKNVIIVTSGAIALGRKKLGLSFKEASNGIPLPKKQAAASAGTRKLLNAYGDALDTYGIDIGQVLVTYDSIRNIDRRRNVRNTINELLNAGIIPVINENDVVSTEEITFGDNDPLSAMITKLINADVLLLASTIDGYYTGAPEDPSSKRLDHITELTGALDDMAHDAPAGASTGGGKSKLKAGKIAALKGQKSRRAAMIIANGQENHFLKKLFNTPKVPSTTFLSPVSAEQHKLIVQDETHLQPS